jgi:hypothetical protein
MTSTTLGELTAKHGFAVLEHLEAEAHVPVHSGLQAQGDLLIIPAGDTSGFSGSTRQVPPEGIAVIEAIGSGHEHRLFAGALRTASFTPAFPGGADIGLLECTEPAYLLHPEHGATGIAPGSYVLRRQREQADVERLVAD